MPGHIPAVQGAQQKLPSLTNHLMLLVVGWFGVQGRGGSTCPGPRPHSRCVCKPGLLLCNGSREAMIINAAPEAKFLSVLCQGELGWEASGGTARISGIPCKQEVLLAPQKST